MMVEGLMETEITLQLQMGGAPHETRQGPQD